MAEVRTICPYCGVGCGLYLITEGNTVTGVKPDKQHPVSQGALCPKGATAHQFVNHPDRLTDPLIKKNGQFVPVSWDEAYDLIVAGLRRIQEQYGKDAVALISSSRSTQEEIIGSGKGGSSYGRGANHLSLLRRWLWSLSHYRRQYRHGRQARQAASGEPGRSLS